MANETRIGNGLLTPYIKLDANVVLDPAIDGVLEYNNSHIYFTIGNTKYQLDRQSIGTSTAHNDTYDRDIAGNHTKLIPVIDSTSAIQFNKADGTTPVINIDTLNSRIGVAGISLPTALLHLPAGTASVGTAPLKLTDGTLNSVPENGAIEMYDGHIYFTGNNIRQALDFVETETANKTLYVRTTGSDTNDGLTSGSAFLTINKAINSIKNHITSPSTSFITITINIGAGTTTLNDHIYWEKLGRNVQIRFVTEYTNIYDNFNISESGTFTSNSRNVHTDTSKTWTPDALVGYWVRAKTVKTGTMPTSVNVMIPIIRNGIDWIETTWTGSASTYLVNQDWDTYDICTHNKITIDFNSKVFKVSTDANYALTFTGFNIINNTAIIGSDKLHIGMTCCGFNQSTTNFLENISFINCYVNTASSLATISVAYNTAFRSSLTGSGIINNTKISQGLFQIAGCVFRSVSTKTANITGINASEVSLKLARNNKFINIYSCIKVSKNNLFLSTGDIEFDTCDYFLVSGTLPSNNITVLRELTTDIFSFFNEPTTARLSLDGSTASNIYYLAENSFNALEIAPEQYKIIKFNTHENTDIDTGTEIIDSFSDLAAKAVRWDIVISKGSVFRTCSINAVWDSSLNIIENADEYGVVKIGNSDDVVLSVDINNDIVRLLATTLSDNWMITVQRYLI